MNSFQDSSVALANILATLPGLIGLIQSRGWLPGIALLLVGALVIVALFARRESLILDSAAVNIEGRNIDSLNIANLRRRVNRSLVIQEAHHIAEIAGEDLKVEWKYSGYCRAERETAIEFSIDAESNIPFDSLDCFAYDLQRDPGRQHKIRPILIGSDGISKKVAVPFLEPLTAQQPFRVLLKCLLPGCMKPGKEYYTSTLSFAQNRVWRCTVRLRFFGERPAWVRVYESAPGGARFLKDLRPSREDQELTEYVDIAEPVEGQSARIYTFWRSGSEHNVPSDR
jgi:hypothetical protein